MPIRTIIHHLYISRWNESGGIRIELG
jgi:hypothetical protein